MCKSLYRAKKDEGRGRAKTNESILRVIKDPEFSADSNAGLILMEVKSNYVLGRVIYW